MSLEKKESGFNEEDWGDPYGSDDDKPDDEVDDEKPDEAYPQIDTNIDAADKSAQGFRDGFKCFHDDELRSILQDKIEANVGLFGSEDIVVFMALYLQWNMSKIETTWFDMPDKQKIELGIEYNKALDNDPEANVSLASKNETAPAGR